MRVGFGLGDWWPTSTATHPERELCMSGLRDTSGNEADRRVPSTQKAIDYNARHIRLRRPDNAKCSGGISTQARTQGSGPAWRDAKRGATHAAVFTYRPGVGSRIRYFAFPSVAAALFGPKCRASHALQRSH